MRQIIYDMMNEITEGYENNPLRTDTLIAISNIAIASIQGMMGIRQEWLIRAINMVPNGVRGHNVLRAIKIRFARSYRQLPPRIHQALGNNPFFPVYGRGDDRVHRMREGLAEYITDWAFEHPRFNQWCVELDLYGIEPYIVFYEEE